MRIISERQLYHDGQTRRAGEPFDVDVKDGRGLIERGVARAYEAPHVVYETRPRRFERPMRRPRGQQGPLVTCLCPTSGRRAAWLPHAIRYFLQQTYINRELLIVAEETEGVDVRVIPRDSQIRLLLYRASSRIPLGAKRNFACAQAQGGLIAHWDDDDYSAPGRLADQVARLLASGKAGTAYCQMKFTDGRRWWNCAGPLINSSLVFRCEWLEQHRFPEIQVASDVPFLNEMMDAGELTAGPSHDLMAASVHPDNTSARSLGAMYQPIDAREGIAEFVIPAAPDEAVAC